MSEPEIVLNCFALSKSSGPASLSIEGQAFAAFAFGRYFLSYHCASALTLQTFLSSRTSSRQAYAELLLGRLDYGS